MNPILKLCFTAGLFVTGSEVVTHGDEHAHTIKRLAAPLLLDRRANKGIEAIPISKLNELPQGIRLVQD